MNILFVMNGCYPYTSTGTNLLNKLLFDGKLSNAFEKIDVLCGKDSFFDKDRDTFNGICIYRTFSWTELPKGELKKLFQKNPILFFSCFIQKLFFHLSRRRFVDKYASRAFYRSLKKIHAEQYDVIISISGRYYQTDAVEKFCEKKKKRFVFYQVDPCGTNEYESKKTLKERIKLEKRLYKTASDIITTDLIFEGVQRYISPENMDKVHVSEFPLVVDNVKENNNANSKIVCTFSGSIYSGIRNPDYTIRLFKPLIDDGLVEVHFLGVDRTDLDKFPFVFCHGRLSIEEARKFVEKSDVLINIGNNVANQVPSKIFDYISTGKPIVNICKRRLCPTLKYINKYPNALILFEKEYEFDQQIARLKDFIEKCDKKPIAFESIKTIYHECTPSFCAELFMRVLCKVS